MAILVIYSFEVESILSSRSDITLNLIFREVQYTEAKLVIDNKYKMKVNYNRFLGKDYTFIDIINDQPGLKYVIDQIYNVISEYNGKNFIQIIKNLSSEIKFDRPKKYKSELPPEYFYSLFE